MIKKTSLAVTLYIYWVWEVLPPQENPFTYRTLQNILNLLKIWFPQPVRPDRIAILATKPNRSGHFHKPARQVCIARAADCLFSAQKLSPLY